MRPGWRSTREREREKEREREREGEYNNNNLVINVVVYYAVVN